MNYLHPSGSTANRNLKLVAMKKKNQEEWIEENGLCEPYEKMQKIVWREKMCKGILSKEKLSKVKFHLGFSKKVLLSQQHLLDIPTRNDGWSFFLTLCCQLVRNITGRSREHVKASLDFCAVFWHMSLFASCSGIRNYNIFLVILLAWSVLEAQLLSWQQITKIAIVLLALFLNGKL